MPCNTMKHETGGGKREKITANILFSGIGFQERGIEMSGAYDLEVTATSEICKESVLSYAAIHNGLTPALLEGWRDWPSVDEMILELTKKNIGYDPGKKKPYNWQRCRKGAKLEMMKKYWLAVRLSRNMGDITRIERLPQADLWTISFPCQSISCAGRMRGFKPDSGTRSSLLWENIRLLKTASDEGSMPKYLLFENVKNLVSRRFMGDFKILLEILGELGYNPYWEVLNAKDCGVPQNRERVFVICIRKDIDAGSFTFPVPFPCGRRLEDLLHDDVDEKYFVGGRMKDDLIERLIGDGTIPGPEESLPWKTAVGMGLDNPRVLDSANAILTKPRGVNRRRHMDTGVLHSSGERKDHVCQIGNVREGKGKWDNPQAGRVYDAGGYCPTLNTMKGGCRQPIVPVPVRSGKESG